MNGVRVIHTWLAALAGATSLAWAGVSADEPPTIASFVGEWKLNQPAGPCDVTLRIRADGMLTMTDGANVVESRLEVLGPQDGGFVPVHRTLVSDNGEAACSAGPDTPPSTPAQPPHRVKARHGGVERAGRVDVKDLLPFAHGDAFALCSFDNIGGCRHWFARVPGARPSAARAVRHDLYGAVERQFYRLVPENLETFELVALGGRVDTVVPDHAAPGHLRPIACERAVNLEVLGRGESYLAFTVSSCKDAALIRSLALEFLHGPANRDNLASPDLSPADKLRYGIGSALDQYADGSEVFYLFEDSISGGAGLPFKFAIHVDAQRTRAIILTGVDMSMTAPPEQLAGNPLYDRPEAILRQLVARIAHDPDSAR